MKNFPEKIWWEREKVVTLRSLFGRDRAAEKDDENFFEKS